MAKKMVLVPAEMLSNMNPKLHVDAIGMANDQPQSGNVLSQLRRKINLTEDNRVIYQDEVGSNVMDLLRYFLLPDQEKPRDASKFASMIDDCNVPKWLNMK